MSLTNRILLPLVVQYLVVSELLVNTSNTQICSSSNSESNSNLDISTTDSDSLIEKDIFGMKSGSIQFKKKYTSNTNYLVVTTDNSNRNPVKFLV